MQQLYSGLHAPEIDQRTFAAQPFSWPRSRRHEPDPIRLSERARCAARVSQQWLAKHWLSSPVSKTVRSPSPSATLHGVVETSSGGGTLPMAGGLERHRGASSARYLQRSCP